MMEFSFLGIFFPLFILASLFSLFYFSGFILVKLLKAFPLKEKNYPDLYKELYGELSFLSKKTGIVKPKLFLLKEQSPNAFAMTFGRTQAIFITEGTLSLLSQEEIRALFSLCFAQIKLKRFLLSPFFTLCIYPAAKLSSILPLFLSIPFHIVCCFFRSIFIQKSRHFLVDSCGKEILGNAQQIANMMRKMYSVGKKLPLAFEHIAFDHLFLFPTHPVKLSPFLWEAQPPMEERMEKILRLSQLA